jgi:Family of unknown function (DUF6228)
MGLLRLESNDGARVLIDRPDAPEWANWHVTIQASDLTAETDVEPDTIGHPVPSLARYFASLAEDWRGWSDSRIWGGDPLCIEATHDGLGHVTLKVALSKGYLRQIWRTEVTLQLDAGALDAIARASAAFEPPGSASIK